MKERTAFQLVLADNVRRNTKPEYKFDDPGILGGISRQDLKDGIPFMLGLSMLLFIMLSIGGY